MYTDKMTEEQKALMKEYDASNVRTYALPVLSERPKWNTPEPWQENCADWCRLREWVEK